MAKRGESNEFSLPSPSRMTSTEHDIVKEGMCKVEIVAHRITSSHVQLVEQNQFSGAPNEDPFGHIIHFTNLVELFQIEGASNEAILLHLFSHSLKDKALTWLENQILETRRSWDALVTKFTNEFLPVEEQARLRQFARTFKQAEGEYVHEAWQRYNRVLRQSYFHALPEWVEITLFYYGLDSDTKQMLDTAAGGSFGKKTVEEAKEIIDTLVYNSIQAYGVRTVPEIQQQARYVGSGGNTDNICSNTHNAGCCHFCDSSKHESDLHNKTQDRVRELEEQMNKIQSGMEKLICTMQAFVEETKRIIKEQNASIRGLEEQVIEFEKLLVKPSHETILAVTLRSGKSYDEPRMKESMSKEEASKKEEHISDAISDHKQGEQGASNAQGPPADHIPVQPRHAPVGLKKEEDKTHCAKFLDMIRKIQVNIPLGEVSAQTPLYVKFMKNLLTWKKGMRSGETFPNTEKDSRIIKPNLLPKLKDPGSFNIPVSIGEDFTGKALCDLGASVNIMPLSVFNKLGIGNIKRTQALLQMVDKSTLRPYGVVEDILVKVENFIMSLDFILLDIKEDSNIPLIFGRPFLATAGVLIDVPKGEVILRVNGEQAIINVFDKPPSTANRFSQLHYVYGSNGNNDLINNKEPLSSLGDSSP